MSRRRRRVLWVLAAAGTLVVLFGALFVLNGLVFADRQEPRMRHFAEVSVASTRSTPGEVTFVSYNIAKGWAHKGGLSFESREFVEAKLRRMAEVIRAEQP